MARTLVADLEEGMEAEQLRVLGIQQFIQQHGAGKKGN